MEPIIEVKNLGKKYKITHERGRYVALRDVIANIIKSPFSFLKQKAVSVVGLEKKENFWALQGIDFSVNRGEVIGVIGHNGAGKSTLLKILSQITPPTEGEIIIHGTVGSLLEVGTGFHPELTGRENIFLNGAILGMTRREIAKKFDQIVEFAGIAKFLDTPVKYYSSGMYVRLAFSVAAHMEPDILLVDEVLAVGDAEFQKKCLGKMEEVTHKDGRTIIFVSHNLEAIKRMCKDTILLSNGRIAAKGPTNTIVDKYLSAKDTPLSVYPTKVARELRIISITPKNPGTNNPWVFISGQDFTFEVEFECFVDIEDFEMGFGISSIGGELITMMHNPVRHMGKGKHTATIKIKNIFNPGSYTLVMAVVNCLNLPDFATLHVVSDKLNEYERPSLGLVDIKKNTDFQFT